MAPKQDASGGAETLLAVLEAHAPEAVVAWLRTGLPENQLQRGLFFGFYAGAGRRFGLRRAKLTEAEVTSLAAAGIAVPEVWSHADLARAALLLSALAVVPQDAHAPLVQEAYQKGDNNERIAVLRSLCLFPRPEAFVAIGVEACRSHVDEIFEAIACDNPFPAAHFDEPAFNQMIMKVLFVGLDLERVFQWAQRNSPDLQRMAQDFATERTAAGRPVPPGVALIAGSK